MRDPQARRFAEALVGRFDRRQALKLGFTAPAIATALGVAPLATTAAPAPAFRALRQEGSGTLTVIRDGGSPNIDPHTAYDNLVSMLFLGIYEMLLRYKGSSTNEYEPMLADSWEVNDDNSVVTFTLAPDVLFHDGTPCDATAVKESFTRFLLLDDGPVNVIKRFVQDLEQMVVVDAQTLRFDLDQPQPLFLAAMASSYGPFVVNPRMIEEHKTEDDPWAREWFMENASGTGPYMLTENSPSEQIILSRFDDYHRGFDGTEFDQIVVRIVPEVATRRQLLERGEADAAAQNLTPDNVDAMRDNPDLNVEIYDSTAVYWAIMNAALLSVDARRGFSYAFPYNEVVESAYRGLVVRSGPLAATVRTADPEVFLYESDLDRAKELILGAGFAEGYSFDYMIQAGDEVESTIAQLFQANVQAMGFTLEIVEVDRAAQVDLVYGDSPPEERPMFVGGWGWWPDYNDPWNQFSPNFTDKTKDGISNSGYWLNERFEEIMAEAEVYTDETQLETLMKEAQNILTEQDPPVIFYGQLQWYTVLRKDIAGFVPNPLYLSACPFLEMSRTSS